MAFLAGAHPRVDSWIREHWAGLLIAACAWALRAVRRTPEFQSSDAANLAVRLQQEVCGGKNFFDSVSDLALYRLGGVQPVVNYIEARLASALGFSIGGRELGHSTLVWSALGVFVAYRFGSELAGKTAGLCFAGLLATSPIHVMTGRHLGAPWGHEILFQLVILWVTVRHFREPSGCGAWTLAALIAGYVWCGNQMPGLFPVLAFALVVARKTDGAREPLARFLRARVGLLPPLLPLGSLAAVFYFALVERRGHWAHALSRSNSFGLYLDNWYSDLVKDLGRGPAWIGLAALVLAAFVRRRVFAWERLPFVYFLGYTLAFWFYVPPSATLTEGYVVYGLTGLLCVLALLPFQFGLPKRWAIVIPALTMALLFAGTLASAHRWYSGKLLGVVSFQGAYQPSIGLEAAAAFIRKDRKDKRGSVFSDHYVEHPQMRFYFRRPVYALNDAWHDKPFKAFAKKARHIKYLVVRPSNKKRVKKYFADFVEIARVVDDRGSGKAVLLVYSKKPGAKVVRLNLSEGAERYRAAYPGLCSK